MSAGGATHLVPGLYGEMAARPSREDGRTGIFTKALFAP